MADTNRPPDPDQWGRFYPQNCTLSVSDDFIAPNVWIAQRAQATCSVAGTFALRADYCIDSEYYMNAEIRARKLLRANLTPRQLDDLDAHQRFVVVGGTTGESYFVEANGNVRFVVSLVPGEGFCVHAMGVPSADKALCMVLMIEHDEPTFLSIANWYGRGNNEAWMRAINAVGKTELLRARDRYLRRIEHERF